MARPAKAREILHLSRVLLRLSEGKSPSRRDLIILRRHAPRRFADLPADELCRYVPEIGKPVEKSLTVQGPAGGLTAAGRDRIQAALRRKMETARQDYEKTLAVLKTAEAAAVEGDSPTSAATDLKEALAVYGAAFREFCNFVLHGKVPRGTDLR